MPNERRYSNELNLESVGINLPYNMQAEQSVLGAVLLKPETLTDLVEIIKPEMFYTRQNAQIWSEMLRLFTSDQTIDFVTLLDAVISDGVFASADEAKVYLTGLAETVPSISNVKAYAQIVQEKYLVRQLMGVAKDILQDAGDEPDADLLLENAEQRIYEIRSGRDSSALTPLSSSMVETLTNLQKISGPDADKYKGIPTGFRLLDTVLTGLGRGDLIILAPGVRAFGENEEMDAMTRKFGYKGRDYVLDLFNKGAFGDDKIMSAAHLIQGSSDGRFTITYCTKPELMSKEEIESVGYQWADYNEVSKRYDPHTLKEGWNTLPDGEEIYFIGTPALGLWKCDD